MHMPSDEKESWVECLFDTINAFDIIKLTLDMGVPNIFLSEEIFKNLISWKFEIKYLGHLGIKQELFKL